MTKKIIVIYNCSKYSKIKDLNQFIINYKKYKPGTAHTLIICFKNLDNKEIIKRKKILRKIKYVSYIDPQINNDFEWGSQKRLAELYKNHFFFFLNDFSYPICKNWLKIFASHIKKNYIIGSMGNLSSHFKNSLYRKRNENYFTFVIKIIYSYINYNNFPNPHIRSTGFMYHAKAYLDFFKDKIVTNKRLSHYYESGKNGMSNFFFKKKYSVFIVNSDNKKFDIVNGKKSLTYASGNQEKLIISDKKTRVYQKLDKLGKKKMTKQAWG